MSDPRRCNNCGAFDAWTGRQRRGDIAGLIVIEHECGVCHQWWRVPIRPNIRVEEVTPIQTDP